MFALPRSGRRLAICNLHSWRNGAKLWLDHPQPCHAYPKMKRARTGYPVGHIEGVSDAASNRSPPSTRTGICLRMGRE